MEDAVEEFVGLDGPAPGRRKARQADDFGLDEEEGVYQLELDDSDDEDDDDLESSEDDEDGDDAMMMPRGRGAGLDEDDEEDDNEDDDEDDEDDDMDDDVSDVDSEADDAAGTVGDPTKGWGRRKSDYYHGDTADLEIGQDFEDAEEEEEAAREMRSAELKGLEGAEDSFFGDLLSGAPAAPALKKGGKKKGAKAKAKAAADPDDVEIAHVSRDLAGLSKKEKLQILMSRAPELLPLLAEARERLVELRDVAVPLAGRVRAGVAGASGLGETWCNVKAGTLANYIINVVYYLLLRCGGDDDGDEPADAASVREHPIVPTLLRFRKVLDACGPLDEQLRGQVKQVLRAPAPTEEELEAAVATAAAAAAAENGVSKKKKGKKGAAAAAAAHAKPVEEVDFMDLILREKERQKAEKAGKYAVRKRKRDESTKDGDKRGATYQIIKNRGLTPHKSKMNRNPRVKKREQYRKALIRRKGAVRNLREGEAGAYGGEQSGINARVSRSRKIGTS